MPTISHVLQRDVHGRRRPVRACCGLGFQRNQRHHQRRRVRQQQHRLTLLNGLALTTGKNGNGLSFDGTNDYLTAQNSPSLDISGNALTLSMWINPTGSTGDQVVLGKHWTTSMTSPYYQYGLELTANGRVPALQIGTTGGVLSASMGSSLAINQWSHLAIVFNGSTTLFYVNGALVSYEEPRRQHDGPGQPAPHRCGCEHTTVLQGLAR